MVPHIRMQNESFSCLFSRIVDLGCFVKVKALYDFFSLTMEDAGMYFIMSYGRLFVINVMENAMRLICISNKKCKYRGVDELKFMNDEYLSKNIFIIYI